MDSAALSADDVTVRSLGETGRAQRGNLGAGSRNALRSAGLPGGTSFRASRRHGDAHVSRRI